MALLRVQAGNWIMCKLCGRLVWPFYDDSPDSKQAGILDDRTEKVMNQHKASHREALQPSPFWQYVQDMHVSVFTVT